MPGLGFIWTAENAEHPTATPRRCNDAGFNCAKSGQLYAWADAAMNACPAGWRLSGSAGRKDLRGAAGSDAPALKAKERGGAGKYGRSAPPGGYGNTRAPLGRRTGFIINRRITMKKIAAVFAAVLLGAGAVMAQGAGAAGTFTDARDGKTYKTMTVGGKTWFAENLNYNTKADDSECQIDAEVGCVGHGRVYDWKTARKVCPNGWRLPSRQEWVVLEQALSNKISFSKFGYVHAAPDLLDDSPGYVTLSRCYVEGLADSVLAWGDKFAVRCVQDGSGDANAAPAAEENASGSFTDSRDSKTYKTRRIGKKRWFAENLNYQTAGGSWCYSNDNSNCAKYGRLYDWKTAMTACPKGWRVPSVDEWNDLEAEAGGRDAAGRALKAAAGWMSGGSGTDDYQFSALPGGARYGDADYQGALKQGAWWTSARGGKDDGWVGSRHIYNDKAAVIIGMDEIKKGFGYSVRCVEE